MKSIGIIGAGFSGTMCAVNLLKQNNKPIKIYLIDSNPSGRGVAYSENDSSFLLNVRADQMGAFAEDPTHFYKWLQNKNIQVEPTSLMPRTLYGEYVQSILDEFKSSSLEIIKDKVVDIDETKQEILFEKSSSIRVDKIILASGLKANTPPDLRKFENSKEDIFILGTGLTMVDTIVYLNQINYQGKITAISRNGRIPAHHKFYPADVPRPVFDFKANHSLLFAIGKIKEHLKNYEWRLVIDALRPHNQFLWSNFSLKEKRQFMRHCRNLWDNHRHRMSPEHQLLIEKLIANGKLEIKSIGYQGKIPASQNLIDLTGLNLDVSPNNKLMNNLFRKNLIQKDELGLGIKSDKHGQVYQNWIFTLGPLRRGQLWECTAVPEIRVQAKELALTLLNQL